MPLQADMEVFEAVSSPSPADFFHGLHWYRRIKSCEKEKASLPGVKKALGKYGSANMMTQDVELSTVEMMKILVSLDLRRSKEAGG